MLKYTQRTHTCPPDAHVRESHVRARTYHVATVVRSGTPATLATLVFYSVCASSDRREGGIRAEESERVMTAEERMYCGVN